MPTDKIKDVYDLISDKGYFTDENEFRSYVNDPKKIKEVYTLIQDDGFFKDEKEFEGYFSDVKKKEPAISLGYKTTSELLESGVLPKQEKPSALKTAATTTPSVSTKSAEIKLQPLNIEQIKAATTKSTADIGKPDVPKQVIPKTDIKADQGSIADLSIKKQKYTDDLNLANQEYLRLEQEYAPIMEELDVLGKEYEATQDPELAKQYNNLYLQAKPALDKMKMFSENEKILSAGLRNVEQMQDANYEKNYGVRSMVKRGFGNTVANIVNSTGKIIETFGDLAAQNSFAAAYAPEALAQEDDKLTDQLARDIDEYYKRINEAVNREVPKSFASYSPLSDKPSAAKLLDFGINAFSQLAPTVVAGITTGGVGAAAMGFAMEFGGVYDTFHDPIKERYIKQGLSEKEAEAKADLEAGLMSTGVATIIGQLDKFGATEMINAVSKKALAKKITQDALVELGEKTGKEAAETAIKKSLVQNLAAFGKGYGKTVLPEATTEPIQELVAPATADVYEALTGEDVFEEGLGDKQTWINAGNAAVGALMASSPMGVISGASGITTQGYKKAVSMKDPAEFDKFNAILTAEVESGITTPEQAQEAIEVIKKVQAADKQIPSTIQSEVERTTAANLLIEKQNITAEIEGKDAALVAPQKERIKEIDAALSDIASGNFIKELETTTETTTDGEGTIEGAISAGTDVAKEGPGVATEPSSEGITGEGVQAETVPQAQVEEQQVPEEITNEYLLKTLPEEKNEGNTGKVMITTDKFGGTKTRYIPFEIIEQANKNDKLGGQTAKEINDRGGYSDKELDRKLPNWRSMLNKPEVSEKVTEVTAPAIEVTPTAEKTVTAPKVSEALRDVESTAKALEGLDKESINNLEKLSNIYYHGNYGESIIDGKKNKYGLISKLKDFGNGIHLGTRKQAEEFLNQNKGFLYKVKLSAKDIKKGFDEEASNLFSEQQIDELYNKYLKKGFSENESYNKAITDLATPFKYKNQIGKSEALKYINTKEGGGKDYSIVTFNPDFTKIVSAITIDEKGESIIFDNSIKDISESYHAAKADGSNPELVSAVEELLGVPTVSETTTTETEVTPTEKKEVVSETVSEKPTKAERKAIAAIPVDEVANKAKDFLDKYLSAKGIDGVKKSGFGDQNKIVDVLANTVKALINAGIEIDEAIKQVREFFEQDYDTSAVKDYEIAQAIARDELTDVAKENGFTSYKHALNAVSKYVREVGEEDVITEEEIIKAKEAKDKEAEAPKKGYTPKKKKAQEGEKEPVIKESGRSKSYEEGRVAAGKNFNEAVNEQKVYYEQMNRKEELANAEGYLESFGNTEEGLLNAYIDMMEVFKTNPYLDPKNSIAIEILADRMFAMAMDFKDKGKTDKYNSFLEKSEKLRQEAFQAHFRAGQYTSAVAVFSRSANPDAFLIFIEGQQEQEFEKAKKSKPAKIKEYEAAVNDFYEKAKEIKKDAARQAVITAPKSTTKTRVKLTDKLKARYDQGKTRQAEALKKLGKINFFGSSGLSNEAIEAISELVLAQFEQGIYKAATIIEKIRELTENKISEKILKEVYDNHTINYKGEKRTLAELEEILRKEEIAEKEPATDTDAALEKEREKLAKIKADYEQAVVDKADALVLKRAQQFVKDQEKKVKEQEDKAKKAATAKTAEGKRPTLADLIQRELEADSTKEQIAKELVEKGGLSEREANKLAEIYYNKYRKILKEKITSQLLKDLTPKKVKQIEAQMNALKDKPYGKTLGGMIASQVAAGALDSEILKAAFSEKYGLPSISPVQADIIRNLSRKARAAKTQLGLQTANKNLLEYVNSFVKPKYGSLLGTLYYMGILTGVSTATVNTFGNVNGLINQSTENFVQSVIEAIQGNKGNLMSSSKPAQKILMAIANMNDSLSAAIDILIHGGGESRYSNIKKDAFGEITTEDLIVKRKDFQDLGFKKLFATLFKLYKTPPALFIRNLPASDEGFTMANFNMEATRELRKKLYAEGYRGADLEKKVFEQVYGTTEIKAKALQEAIKELKRIGIDPANRKILANRIAKEIIANSLDENVQNVANEVAKENTFRGKPRGMAGYLSRKIPQTWLISPFVTTPSRILEKHMNYIPLYGAFRYYGYTFSENLRKIFPGFEKDFVRKGVESAKREGELRNKQLAQVLTSHALLLVLWGLSQIDWEDEKGNVVPFVDASAGYMGTDIEERKRLEELMPAYMIRIGNFKFSYKTNPLLAMIALPLGVIKDSERSFEAADYSKLAYAYNFELFNFLYESNPIQGFQDFFEGLGKSLSTIKEEMTLESIAALPVKMAADFSSSVAVDNFYKQIVDFTDPDVHEAQDLMEVVYKSWNMEKIGDLTPTHDRWGRPVKRYPGESFFPLQHLFNNNDDKKITEWEIKNGIEIPTINRKTLVLTNNTLKTEKSIKNQREELVKDYGLTSDEVKYFDEALNSDFKLLTKDEWDNMSKTVRYDVFTMIKNNFDNATEEYKKFYKESINSEERNIKPISKLSRPDAKKLVEILFKIKKRDYINKNFTKIE
jgi:hypothetical protein